jgi:hypothetical protein
MRETSRIAPEPCGVVPTAPGVDLTAATTSVASNTTVPVPARSAGAPVGSQDSLGRSPTAAQSNPATTKTVTYTAGEPNSGATTVGTTSA